MSAPKSRVTMSDIAKRLDVTVSTVSRAINQPHRISTDTRAKVMELVRKMHYSPNSTVRNLRANKTGNFGYIYNRDCPISEKLPAMRLFEALEIEAQGSGYNMVLSSVDNNTKDAELPLMVRDNRVDGIFLGGRIESRLIKKIQQSHTPLILLANHSLEAEIDCVIQDNIRGAYQAVSHLMDNGHERIGFIGAPFDELWSWERLQGMRLTFDKRGMKLDDELIHVEDMWSPAEGFHELMQLSEPPTAIFCANDRLARRLLKVARAAQVEIPGDVSLVGFDNEPWTGESWASVTTVDICVDVMAKAAISKMRALMADNSDVPLTTLTPTSLIVRESTLPLPRLKKTVS